jgi:transcriptional regulator with XRE-family HTH domain
MIKLKELRESAGKTMKEVARDLDIKYTTYITYEKGTYEPSLQTLKDMAEYFHVTVSELIDDAKNETSILHEAKKRQDEEELARYLDMLRTRPEMRVLLDTVKGATKEEVEANVHFLETLRGKRD